jgi:polygalacturonase
MMIAALGLSATAATPAGPVARAARPATSPAAVFDVRASGAVGDGKADDRGPIQAAVDRCAAAGGGTVEVPAGTYACCGVMLRSHVTLQLDAGATLQGPSKADDWPRRPAGNKGSGWSGPYLGVVGGEGISDVAITGRGRIDGAGQASWAIEHAKLQQVRAAGVQLKAGASATDRARLVQFARCDRVSVTGVTLSNSQMWTLVFNQCRDVLVDGLTITAPADSPETDGVDVRGCRQARVTRCDISNGDDNVAITGARTPLPGDGAACQDVEVDHCTFGHGHGVSIGSPTMNGVRHVRVHDCAFTGTTNGIRIKSTRDRGGTVEDVRYDRLTMTDVNPAITVNAYYVHPPAVDATQPVTPLTPVFRDIHVYNLTATCPKSAGMIVGLPEAPVSGVTFDNVRITARTGMLLRDVSGIDLAGLHVTVDQGPPLVETNVNVR